jgi:uncharacterized membrane protein YqgA involved in biofilm formation
MTGSILMVVGSILNAAGIVIGALAGLSGRSLSPASQSCFKTGLGAFAAFLGLRLVWDGLNGPFRQIAGQILVALAALILGRFAGRLLRLQKISNRLGQFARLRIAAAVPGKTPPWSEGFNTCTALFCAAPLAVLGSVTDGLAGNFFPLALKAVMDALAAMSFAAMFGAGGVAMSALPVFAWQGTLTLLCAAYAAPFLLQHHLLDAVNVVAGLQVVFVALVIFEVRKIELADYLPALALAPLLAWFWH